MWIDLDELRMIDLEKVRKIECDEFDYAFEDRFYEGDGYAFPNSKKDYLIKFFIDESHSHSPTLLAFKTKKERDAKYKYFKKLLKGK